jgi:predicted FMN-binding regulatory protein PaiB
LLRSGLSDLGGFNRFPRLFIRIETRRVFVRARFTKSELGIVASHIPCCSKKVWEHRLSLSHVGRPDEARLHELDSHGLVIIQGPLTAISPGWCRSGLQAPTWVFM